MPRRTESEYVDLGRGYILSILQREYAATPAELEARCAERDGTSRLLIDVNHVYSARDSLLAEGAIEFMPAVRTRGRHAIPIFHLPVVRGNARVIADSAARKRLLQARWQGWAIGTTRYPKGLVGPAGERVLSATVLHPDLRGTYLPVQTDAGEVRSLFGARVPGGALDSGAYIVGRAGGLAGRPVLLAMEMKNLRHWLFPRSPELFQLLDKSARLALGHPDMPIAPVLVCRRRHHTTFKMAADLGFFVIEVHRQFMLPSAEAPTERVEEVRSGIGFKFLAQTVEPDPILLTVLRRTVPTRAEATARRFLERASTLAPLYERLRDDELGTVERDALFDSMRTIALALPDSRGGW